MVSNMVREVRKKRGMTLAELSRRTNVHRVTLTKIEHQLVAPNIKTALAISRELDRKVDEIFFETDVNHDLH